MRGHSWILLLAFILACFTWLTHGLLDSFLCYDLPLSESLFRPSTHEVHMRILSFVLFMTLGGLVAWLIIRRDVPRLLRLRTQAHHNSVLRAIRRLNLELTGISDAPTFAATACRLLTGPGLYDSVWILLVDETGEITNVQARGLHESVQGLVHRKIGDPDLPRCLEKALSQANVFVLSDPAKGCPDCLLKNTKRHVDSMAVRLSQSDTIYGVLSVTTSSDLCTGGQEIELGSELASDMALALHDLAARR